MTRKFIISRFKSNGYELIRDIATGIVYVRYSDSVTVVNSYKSYAAAYRSFHLYH